MSASLIAILLVGLFLVLVGFAAVRAQGWLTPLGIGSETADSQVIRSVERTSEVALLSLGIQGITDRTDDREVFGFDVPGTSRTLFLQYGFDAKLGVDGSEVDVERTGANEYEISVPEFTFIGYDDVDLQSVAEDGGVLRFATPDIDQSDVINEILDADGQQQYVNDNRQLLEDQAEFFYGNIVRSVDPAAEVTFEFTTDAR